MYNNILDLLENSCKNYPDKAAFGDVERDITFRELIASAKSVGTLLTDKISMAEPVAFYMDKSVDADYKVKLSFNASGHANNYVMVGSSNTYSVMLRSAFERGIMRFKNQECKSAFFEMLKYSVMV